MPPKCEVHISGVIFSYLVSSLLSSIPSMKKCYALFGNYDLRVGDSDMLESTMVVEAFVTALLPLGVEAPEGTVLLGYASVRKLGPHKLSFDDTKILLGEKNSFDIKREKSDSSYPIFLLLVTSHLDMSSRTGTNKVEYSVFQSIDSMGSSHSVLSNKYVVPIKVDNMVDSLSGFVRLSSLACHSSTDILRIPSLQDRLQPVETAFDYAVAELEEASKKKQELIQRVMELEKLISEKKCLR